MVSIPESPQPMEARTTSARDRTEKLIDEFTTTLVVVLGNMVREKTELKETELHNLGDLESNGERRQRKIGVVNSPIPKGKKKLVKKKIDFTTYLPPVRAPTGSESKGKRTKTKRGSRKSSSNKSAELISKSLKLPPIGPACKEPASLKCRESQTSMKTHCGDIKDMISGVNGHHKG